MSLIGCGQVSRPTPRIIWIRRNSWTLSWASDEILHTAAPAISTSGRGEQAGCAPDPGAGKRGEEGLARVFELQGVAQFALQELAVGVAGQRRVGHPDVAGRLVLGDALG